MTHVKFLCGAGKATSTELIKDGYDGLVPFLHGANSLEPTVQVAQAGKQLIKRKLEVRIRLWKRFFLLVEVSVLVL